MMSPEPTVATSISAFFPAFNDAENLQVLVPRADEALRRLAGDFEIIVVDDGSTDHTSIVLDSLQQQCPSLRVVRHQRNLGYGAALQSGFRNARKELVFYAGANGASPGKGCYRDTANGDNKRSKVFLSRLLGLAYYLDEIKWCGGECTTCRASSLQALYPVGLQAHQDL
jgi:glycosyltransferase involved in cell wall biosynthesis